MEDELLLGLLRVVKPGYAVNSENIKFPLQFDPTSNILFDIMNPRLYIDYISGFGSDNPMIDEKSIAPRYRCKVWEYTLSKLFFFCITIVNA